MKKFIPILLIFLFLGMAAIGYKLASNIFQKSRSSLPSPTITSFLPVDQKNYLLIQVNDLQEKKPELISIWGLIFTNTSSTDFFFISLYPTTNLGINDEIETIFSMTKKGTLTTSSFRRLKRLFDIPFEEYFLLDEHAILEFASYEGIDQLNTFSSSPDSSEKVASVQSRGKTFFTSFCDILISGVEQSFFSKMEWSSLSPAHFRSSLNMDELQTHIADLDPSTVTDLCRVVILQ